LLPRYRRNASIANYVMRSLQLSNDLRHLKLAQDFGRPYAMRSAFADRCVVNAHEVERRRDCSVWFDQREPKRASLRQGQL